MDSVKSEEAQLPLSFFIQANSLWSMMGQLLPRLEKLFQASPKNALVLKAPNGVACTVEMSPVHLISFITNTLHIREDFAENMILVFKHIVNYHFLVAIFNGDGCAQIVNECCTCFPKETCIVKRSDSIPQDDNSKVRVEKKQTFSKFLSKSAFNRQSHSMMWLPKGFIKPKELPKACGATIRAGQKEWKVRMSCHRHSGQACFTGLGWLSFVTQNQLKIGDECIFTLTDSSKWVFNLRIVK